MSAFDVPCPRCGAGVGQRCRTTTGTGRVTDTHQARFVQAARRVRRQGVRPDWW